MMNEFLIINIKVALSLSAVVIFYKLFLSRNTFFELNRYYFLVGMCLSVVISCIPLDWYLKYDVVENETAPIANLITNVRAYTVATEKSIAIDIGSIFFILWSIGFAFHVIKFCIQIYVLQKLRQGAVIQKINDLEVYVTTRNMPPFSFGNSIFLPQSCIGTKTSDQIVAHEEIHINQWHSADIVMAELVCCFVWYSPLNFMLRKSIKHNLEFLTDALTLDQGFDKKEYQYLLVEFSSAPSLQVASFLNNNFLKNRVKMMNQKRTNDLKKGVYVFFIPLILCVLFSFTYLPGSHRELLRSNTFSGDTIGMGDIDHIEIYGQTGKGDTAYIHYKNGRVEKKFLKNKKENILFHQKYKSVLPQHQLADKPKIAEYEPLNIIPEEIKEFTMNDEFIWLTLKNGSKEQYQISDEKQKLKFESKYGKLIVKRK